MTPADDTPTGRDGAAPAGEEVHLPGPSLLPFLVALGVSIALIGVIMHWLLAAVGVVMTVWASVVWIRDCRRDIDELPLEHH